MRQHYRHLFSSCLLAALILPSHPAGAVPSQEPGGGLRTDWTASPGVPADHAPTVLPGLGEALAGVSEGLKEQITTGNLAGPARDPVLGRISPPSAAELAAAAAQGPVRAAIRPAVKPVANPATIPAGATSTKMAAAAQAATMSEPAAPTPSPGSGATGAPPPSFAAPRPALPQALTDAIAALAQKKPEDAVRLARTFLSQADAKGPGPESTPPLLALAHELIGTGLAVQNKPDEAIVELQKALAISPQQGSVLFKLGVIYREQGKLAEAKTYLERAAPIVGGDPVKLFLGDVNERLGDIPAAIQIYEALLAGPQGQDPKFKLHLATLYDRTNRFADAIKLLEPMVTVESKDAEALMTLGFAYGGSGKPKQAMPLLLAAKAAAPDNWRVDLALGTAQRELGEFDAAEASLKRVVAAEPKQVQARFQLALTQMGKSQFQEAADTLAEAVKLAPNAVEIKQTQGDALFRAGKKDAAVAIFKELATRDGAQLNDYVNLARAYQATDHTEEGVQTYKEALQKFPPNPGVYALLALSQAQQKKFSDARQTIATGRKLTPDDPQLLRALIQTEIVAGDMRAALPVAQHLVDVQPKSLEDRFGLASLYGRMGDRKNAISTYRALLADAPNSPVVLNNLASVMTDDGDAKGALPLAKRALELQPKSAATNDTMGWALLKSGQTKEALALFETATQMDPSNPELLYHLGMAQKASNNLKAARGNLEKALSMSPSFEGNVDAKAALASLPK